VIAAAISAHSFSADTLVPLNQPIHGSGGGEVVELAMGGEDDDADVGVAEHRELSGLLEQASAALAEGDLTVDGVLDAAKLDLASRHG